MWQRRKDWFYVLIMIAIIAVYTVWRLHLNPQHIPLFLTTTIIALGFVVVMALLPKYRRRLVKGLLAYNTRQKELGGWLYRYRRIALVLFFIIILTFPLLLQFQFIPSSYMPWAVLTFFYHNLSLRCHPNCWIAEGSGMVGVVAHRNTHSNCSSTFPNTVSASPHNRSRFMQSIFELLFKHTLIRIRALGDKIKRKNVWVSKLRIPYAIRTKFTSLARATLF